MTGAATEEAPSWKPASCSTVCLVLQFAEGKCAEAIDLYKDVLGATTLGSAMKVNDMIMHQMLDIGGSSLMLSDNVKADEPIKGCTAYVYVEDVDSTCKKAQSAGFKVLQEPETMFWGDRMARTRDPYGNEWTLSTLVNSDVSEEAMDKGLAEMAEKSKRPREEAEDAEQNKAQKVDEAPAAAEDTNGEAAKEGDPAPEAAKEAAPEVGDASKTAEEPVVPAE